MNRRPVNLAIDEMHGAIRDAEWQDTFLHAEPQTGRIRRWLVDAVEILAGTALIVAGFYGLLFLTLLGG